MVFSNAYSSGFPAFLAASRTRSARASPGVGVCELSEVAAIRAAARQQSERRTMNKLSPVAQPSRRAIVLRLCVLKMIREPSGLPQPRCLAHWAAIGILRLVSEAARATRA